EKPGESVTQIRLLLSEARDELVLVGSAQAFAHLAGETEKVTCVVASERLRVGGPAQHVNRELAERLEHREALLLAAKQALVHQGCHGLDTGPDDGFGRRKRT